jgi:hypothetical protein
MARESETNLNPFFSKYKILEKRELEKEKLL